MRHPYGGARLIRRFRPNAGVPIAEVDRYQAIAKDDEHRESLRLRLTRLARQNSDAPLNNWLDSQYDRIAQRHIYTHLEVTARGGTVLQIGGSGIAVIKFLMTGAAFGMLATPVEAEADLAVWLARKMGVDHQLRTVIATGEDLAVLADESFDVVVMEATLHHTKVSSCLREVMRLLRPGGRFGAFDPWKTHLYSVGTFVFGKQDPDVQCVPLTEARLGEHDGFIVARFSPATRYIAIVLGKFGVVISPERIERWALREQEFLRIFGAANRLGSLCALTATKVSIDRGDVA